MIVQEYKQKNKFGSLYEPILMCTKTGKSKYIFNAIYDTSTRKSTEQHIKQIQFLNRNVNVHEYLKEPLKRVEEKINSLSQKNKDVKNFLEELSSCESYNWRNSGFKYAFFS